MASLPPAYSTRFLLEPNSVGDAQGPPPETRWVLKHMDIYWGGLVDVNVAVYIQETTIWQESFTALGSRYAWWDGEAVIYETEALSFQSDGDGVDFHASGYQFQGP